LETKELDYSPQSLKLGFSTREVEDQLLCLFAFPVKVS
jgi:hypothetical protein